MTIVQKAICWAVALFAVAAAKRFGLIDAETGEVMLLVLPIVAVTTMFRRGGCCGKERRT